MSYKDISANAAMTDAIHHAVTNATMEIVQATGCHTMSAGLILAKGALNMLAHADEDAVRKLIANLPAASTARHVDDDALTIEKEQVTVLISAYERQTSEGST